MPFPFLRNFPRAAVLDIIYFTVVFSLKVHLRRYENGYPEIMLFRLIKKLKESNKRLKEAMNP